MDIITTIIQILVTIAIAYFTTKLTITKESNLTKFSILQICIQYFHHIDNNPGNINENHKKVFIQELESIFNDLKDHRYTNYFNHIFKKNPSILSLLMNLRREIHDHISNPRHFSFNRSVFLQFHDLYKTIKNDIDKKLLKKKYFVDEDNFITNMCAKIRAENSK